MARSPCSPSIATCRPEPRYDERTQHRAGIVRRDDRRRGPARRLDRARAPRDLRARRRRARWRPRPRGRSSSQRRPRRGGVPRRAPPRRDRPPHRRAARAARVSPALRWLRRWGISFASPAGGIAPLFVFRRGLPHVAWIIGYLLLLWLLFALVTQMRQPPHPPVAPAMGSTVHTLYHA